MLTAAVTSQIVGADPHIVPDERDKAMLHQRIRAWNGRSGPRVGDYVRFSDGVLHRFSYHWRDGEGWDGGIQTSKGGSFHFGDGYMSFSGGLDPCIPTETITPTAETMRGAVWFFHHGYAHAHSAVYARIPCRVYETALPSDHWKL